MCKMSGEQEYLGRLFKQIHIAFETNAARDMRVLRLTPSQMDILLLVYVMERRGKEVTQKDIETCLRLSNPTVTGTLNRMEEKHLICRVRKVADKRCRFICLTEHGREYMEILKEARKKNDGQMIKGMTSRQVEELTGLLKLVLANLTETERL